MPRHQYHDPWDFKYSLLVLFHLSTWKNRLGPLLNYGGRLAKTLISVCYCPKKRKKSKFQNQSWPSHWSWLSHGCPSWAPVFTLHANWSNERWEGFIRNELWSPAKTNEERQASRLYRVFLPEQTPESTPLLCYQNGINPSCASLNWLP